MKTIVCVFPLALTLTAAQAQDAPCGQWNPERIKWDGCPDRVWDKQFTAYTAALWAATVLDVETTRSALDNCVGCQEGNPMFGDDPSRGRIYAVMAPINVGVMWLSYRMKKRGSKWWMMPILTLLAAQPRACVIEKWANEMMWRTPDLTCDGQPFGSGILGGF